MVLISYLPEHQTIIASFPIVGNTSFRQHKIGLQLSISNRSDWIIL